MKLSLNWLRDYLDLHKTPAEIADILTSLGLEVEGLDEVKPSLVDLDKVVTSLVLTCAPIPDTDHLSATTVDTGNGIPRSIVCGAPNVAAGQKVLVALPGANVFSKDGQLFTIGERKVRGVPSQGMICAEDELGLGHDHAGIMVLPADTPLGVTAAQYFKQEADVVIEVGLTPNRADATSHVGVARDLGAWFMQHENPDLQLCLPKIDPAKFAHTATPIAVTVDNTEACPRYAGVLLRGLTVRESPDWLKNRLLAIGQRPINNLVDVTNYVRAELGQPLHAFDAAKIKGNTILVKTLPEGTVFKSLDGQERKLFAEDLMICDGDSNPMCIGGVFGGADSGVQDGTTDIFLESAFFNPRWIRRSMLRHNLRTDAAWTFEKGVDPNGSVYALHRAALLMLELAGGEIASATVDLYPNPIQPAEVRVDYARVNALIGEDLPKASIHNILDALSIRQINGDHDGFTALIPTNKPDVTREADVIEEILRVYGLDTVKMPARIRISPEVTPKPNPTAIHNLAADFLSANGFNECMSLSLANSAYFEGPTALMPVPEGSLVRVHNTANQGLDCLRPTLLTSGLDAIRHNQNRQNADLRLYELGKVYERINELPNQRITESTNNRINDYRKSVSDHFVETLRLGVWVTGTHSTENWHPTAKKAVDFYSLKAVVQNLLTRLGISGYQETVLTDAPFEFALRCHRGAQELVTLGKVQTALSRKFDVKNAVFFADFNLENVLKAVGTQQIRYQEISKYPTVRRDLALVLDSNITFGEIRQLANKIIKKQLKEVNLFDVFEDTVKLGEGKKSYAVSFVFEDASKTLQDKEIDGFLQQLQQAFETKLNANIRK